MANQKLQKSSKTLKKFEKQKNSRHKRNYKKMFSAPEINFFENITWQKCLIPKTQL